MTEAKTTAKHDWKARITAIRPVFLAICLCALGWRMVVPTIGRHVESHPIRVQSEIAALSIALAALKIDTGAFPQGTNGLKALVQNPAASSNWHGPYLADQTNVPMDIWGRPFVYQCPGLHNKNGFDLMSTGPDGLAGTKDDIANWSQTN